MRFLSVLALLLVAASSSLADFTDLVLPKAHDDDAMLTVPELIEKYGYPVEVHQVETGDGYILEMHRIPYGLAENAGSAPNKPVVFLQHGLMTDSAVWVITGPKKGLGFLLADLGYDVWMGNTRGNTYSRKHKTLDPSKAKFWDFSWHELGIYDLPAMIDYMLQKTGQTKTFYIGHSQGTTAFYVMASEKPEYNSKIRAQFSLAPMAYMNHVLSPLLRFIALYNGQVAELLKLIGVHEFQPSSSFIAQISDQMCGEDPITQIICKNPLFLLCGFNVNNIDKELLPVILGHTPAPASVKQILHYAQLVNLTQGKFRQYDYGILKNTIKYGRPTPPSYKLENISAPVALFYSHNDWLAAETDVLKLYTELSNPIGRFLVADERFTHLDFLWGKNVVELVYNKVFNLMNRY